MKVSVFSLTKDPNAVSPWKVKWRVNGRDRTRAFRTKAEAEVLWAALTTAKATSAQFDLASGLPKSMVVTTSTFAELACAYVESKWTRWSAKSRESVVDALSVSVGAAVQRTARTRPDPMVLSTAIQHHLLTPSPSRRKGAPTPEQEAALKWLGRYSLPLSEMTVEHVDRLLGDISRTRAGAEVAPRTMRRRRAALSGALNFAVSRRLLDTSPLELSDWKMEEVDDAVPVSTVLNPKQCRKAQALMRKAYPRLEIVIATIWMAGLRPSEMFALRARNVILPKTNTKWGILRVEGAVTSAGVAWTNSGQASEVKGLKARAKDHVREVPMPPELVAIYRKHIRDNQLQPDDLVVSSARGGFMNDSTTSRYWKEVREKMFPAGDPLRDAKLYDLRHTCATILLTAGVEVPEVARRLGNSPIVVMREYAGVLADSQDRANAAVEALLSQP
jgi:integrase